MRPARTAGHRRARVVHCLHDLPRVLLRVPDPGARQRLIKRRTAISNAIGTARKSLGGPRIVYSREMAILERFRELGPAGTDLGMMLLAMGRGRLGRK